MCIHRVLECAAVALKQRCVSEKKCVPVKRILNGVIVRLGREASIAIEQQAPPHRDARLAMDQHDEAHLVGVGIAQREQNRRAVMVAKRDRGGTEIPAVRVLVAPEPMTAREVRNRPFVAKHQLGLQW